jgi:hypothetical protein
MKRTERVAIEEHTERRILESPMRQAFGPTRASTPERTDATTDTTAESAVANRADTVQ